MILREMKSRILKSMQLDQLIKSRQVINRLYDLERDEVQNIKIYETRSADQVKVSNQSSLRFCESTFKPM